MSTGYTLENPLTGLSMQMTTSEHTPQEKETIRLCFFGSTLHDKWSFNIGDAKGYLKLINRAGYDAVFLRYKHIYGTRHHPKIFLKRPKPDVHWLLWSVDTSQFCPRLRRLGT